MATVRPTSDGFFTACGLFNNSAHNAGLRVNELKVEIIVLTATVSANCRKNAPTIPEMNAHGMNTAANTTPTAMIGPDT